MKHAILILSSYGADYLNNNINQFSNDVDIFIHLDKKSLDDKNDIIKKDNIRFCDKIFNIERYSIEMCQAMFSLLKKAREFCDYDYYHFFSDHCYIYKTIDYFKKFFEDNKGYSFIEYGDNKLGCFTIENNKKNFLWKGSQWCSLYKDIVNEILNKEEIFNSYKDKFLNGKIVLNEAAIDEVLFHSLIINDIFNRNFDEINKHIINKSLRYVYFNGDSSSILTYSKLKKYNIKKIRIDSLILRKIDYKNQDSLKLIEELKKLDDLKYNKKFQLWSVYHNPEDVKRYDLKNTENLKLFNVKSNDYPGICINNLNNYFSEFVCHYYVWRNQIKSDYIGICHYRRQFDLDNIDFNRLDNNEVQAFDVPSTYLWKMEKTYNKPSWLAWCIQLGIPSYVMYSYFKILSKYSNKSVNEVINDFKNIKKYKDFPTYTIFICKWDIFDKTMTFFNEFLNDVFPKYDDGNTEKHFNNLLNITSTLNDTYIFSVIKNYPENGFQVFHFNDDDELKPNTRFMGHITECLYGMTLAYFYKIFVIDTIYLLDYDKLDNNENLIYKIYDENVKNGFKFFYIHSSSGKEIKLNYDKYKYQNIYIVIKKDLLSNYYWGYPNNKINKIIEIDCKKEYKIDYYECKDLVSNK